MHRPLRCWWWLLPGLCLLPGCVATVSTQVNLWGWGKRVIEVEVVPAENARAVQALMRSKLGSLYKVYVRDIGTDRKIVTAVRRFRKPSDAGDCIYQVVRPQGRLARVFKLRIEYRERLRLHSLIATPDEDAVARTVDIRYRLRLPGRFLRDEMNPAEYDESGWAVWSFKLFEEGGDGKEKVFIAVSERWNYFTTFLAFFVLAVLAWFFLPLVWEWVRPRALTPEEEERRRQEQEEKRRQAEERRQQQEAEREARQQEQAERKRQQQAERERRRQQQEAEREAKQQEQAERKRQQQAERERRRRQKEEGKTAGQEEAEEGSSGSE